MNNPQRDRIPVYLGGVPETGRRGIGGELVRVGRGGRKQLDRIDVAGKVALVEWQVARLWPYHIGLELGLRGAKAMIVYCPPGGPYYQAPDALGTFDGLWHAEAPPCVTIRREDGAKLSDGAQVRVVLDAPLTPGAEATAYDEAGDCQSGPRRALACLRRIVPTAPEQNLAEVNHETRSVGRHHASGRRLLECDLHEGVLHCHR